MAAGDALGRPSGATGTASTIPKRFTKSCRHGYDTLAHSTLGHRIGLENARRQARDAVPASRNADRDAEAEILGPPSPEGPTPLALAQVQRVIRSCAPGPCPG